MELHICNYYSPLVINFSMVLKPIIYGISQPFFSALLNSSHKKFRWSILLTFLFYFYFFIRNNSRGYVKLIWFGFRVAVKFWNRDFIGKIVLKENLKFEQIHRFSILKSMNISTIFSSDNTNNLLTSTKLAIL